MIKLTVTTPAPLSDEEKQKLAVAFNTQYKEKVAVDYRTDNALSASLIVFDGKNESSFTKLTVISSVELSPAQKQKVEDTFRKKYSNGILAEYLRADRIRRQNGVRRVRKDETGKSQGKAYPWKRLALTAKSPKN